MALTLENTNPTLFNFTSDVIAVIINVAFTMAAGSAFAYLMSRHIQAGNSIPVMHLGQIPQNFFASTRFAHLLHWSGPAIALALLLAIGDFSHSIADLGLTFNTVDKEGPTETVLSLAMEDRNPKRLLELSSDPLGPRSRPLPQSGASILDGGDVSQYRREFQLIDSFLLAVTHIADGESPFLGESADSAPLGGTYFGVPGSAIIGDPAIAQIDLEIPLDCSASQMEKIPQSINGNATNRIGLYTEALVPNCTFSSRRSSGIYNRRPSLTPSQAEIVEEFVSLNISSFNNLDNVFVIQGGKWVKNVTFTPASKTLARDREDWTRGRQVPSIDGVRFGDLTLRFGTTVLATGDYDDAIRNDMIFPVEKWVQKHWYFLVSNVDGECPFPPSGQKEDNVECLVFTTVSCDEVFQEDIEAIIPSDWKDIKDRESIEDELPQSQDDICGLFGVTIQWVQNFNVDEELVAVVAAVLTRSRLDVLDFDFGRVTRHATLAALFAIGSTVERPSIQPKVSPQVNGVYVFFLLLPVLVALPVFLATFWRPRLGIPTNPWELLVLGHEADIPTRDEACSEFPTKESSKYVFSIDKQDTWYHRPTILRIRGSKERPQDLEHQQQVEETEVHSDPAIPPPLSVANKK